MKNTIIYCAQGSDSPEWFAARLGRATGSKASVLMEGKTAKEKTGRTNYIYELAEQRITGVMPAPGFMNDAMKWGNEYEPFARMAYEGATGHDVVQTGFIRCDEIMAGCSLDGHVIEGDRMAGIIEIKCPMLKTHIGYLKANALPDDYKWQVTHNLLTTGADWCDFVSYRPGFRTLIVRVMAKDLPLEEYHKSLLTFLREVDECEKEIRSYAA